MMQTSRRLILLNLALIVVLGASASRLYDDWLTYGRTHQVSAVQPDPEPQPMGLAELSMPESIDEWSDVAVYNPFSFDRSDESAMRPESEIPRGPVPVLYGTLSIGSEKTALLVSAESRDSRAYRPTKIGQTIDGWTLVEVNNKSVVVELNTARETIVMNDPAARVRSQAGRAAATRNASAPNVVVTEEPTASTPPSRPGSRQTMAPARAGPEIPPGYEEVVTPFGRKIRKVPGR